MRHISDETREMIDRSHYLYFSNKTEVDVHGIFLFSYFCSK